MSYYRNPYPQFPYTAYQAQRRDIQLRISDIQQRLRFRREDQLNRRVEQDELQRLRQYEEELLYRLSLEQQHEARKMAEQQKQRLLNEAQEERLQLQHLEKLQRIKRQQDLLYQQKLAEEAIIKEQSLRRTHFQRVVRSGSIILSEQQKYQRDLQRYYQQKILKDPKNSHLAMLNQNKIEYEDSEPKSNNNRSDKNYDSIKKSNRSEKFVDSQSKRRSPFDKLKNKVSQFKYKDSSNKKSYLQQTGTNRKNNHQEDQNKISVSQDLIPTFNVRKSNGNILNGEQIKQKVKQIVTPNKNQKSINRSLSPYRVLSNDKRKSKKRSELKRSINISANQGNQGLEIMTHQMHKNAMKKIENRLKLSSIVYQDSQKRNIKHETNHLFNTFENQVKVRKQVREKINTNPMILRKHKMVVQ